MSTFVNKDRCGLRIKSGCQCQSMRCRSVRGQSTVELAVCLPIMLIMVIGSFNYLLFVSACARFDPLAAEAVRTQATSPGGGEYGRDYRARLIESCLVEGMGDSYHLSVTVSIEPISYGGFSSSQGSDIVLSLLPEQERVVCTMEFFPVGVPRSILGFTLPTFTHSREFVIDPYRPGGLF